MAMHLPVRPVWTCAGCGQVWPCLTRKRQLLAEFAGARVSLMLYLTQFFVEACVDMPTTTTGTLYHRLFAWPYEPTDAPPREQDRRRLHG
ncbi:hypothetical protein [Salinispora arenicola]|uniref:hypothetical protein n=1 Tax=Salinispora arenicola TaxID=168697 RepID=UPI000360DEC4|nr:hypothetical protein [Salinispora arenicola]